jgi:hypothetical protein
VIAVDKRKDIAFLKVPAVDLPTVKLGRSNTVEVGNTVFSIGNPLGLQNTLSQGLVSGIREMDGYRLFQMSAPISPGSSGGPVFDSKGEVIGIAVLTIEGGQNLNFAIPIDYARGMVGMSQTQPLASIYEPEPPSEVAAKPEASPVSTSARVNIPEDMRKGSFAYLERQMGVWSLVDAKAALGEPARQRDALAGTKVDGTIFAFPDPTGAMREFELNFFQNTVYTNGESIPGRLRAVYAYPYKATLPEAQALWGKKYREVKNPNGTRSFLYQDRRLIIVANRNDEIISLGVYLP